MDLNSIVALGIFGTIGLIFTYKMLNRYLKHEKEIVTSDQKSNFENKIRTLESELVATVNSRNGYKQKLNFLRNNYDIDFDDEELLEDPTIETEQLIPEIVSALFPKMPKKLTQLLGREDIQDAIFKVAEKNPDKIAEWVGKFFSKKDEPQTKTQVLKEKYL